MKKILPLLFFFQIGAIQVIAQWEQIPTPPSLQVHKLYTASNKLYAGTSEGLYVQEDDEWRKLGDDFNQRVASILLKANYLFAGTRGGGLYRSSNNGETWVALTNNINFYHIIDIQLYGDNVIIDTDGPVLRSLDNGVQWQTSLNPQGNSFMADALTAHRDSLYAFNSIGFFVSTDAAGSWWKKPAIGIPASPEVKSLISVGTTLFAAIEDKGVYSSSDRGIAWTQWNTNLVDLNFSTLYYDGQKLYIGTGDGLYSTTNLTAPSWTKETLEIPIEEVNTLVSFDNSIHFGNKMGAFKKGTTNFTLVNQGFAPIRVDKIVDLDTCMIANTNNGLWRYDYVSGEWNIMGSFPDFDVNGLVVFQDSIHVANSANGIFISNDSTKTWYQVLQKLSVSRVIANDTALFAAADGVYRSLDQGTTWLPVNIGLPSNGNVANIFILGDYLFAEVGGELYRSSTGGDEWEALNSHEQPIYKTAIKGSTVYAITAGNILYSALSKSIDFGETWTDVQVPISNGIDYNYMLDGLTNLTVIDTTMFTFTGIDINISPEDDTKWYRYNKNYADALEPISVSDPVDDYDHEIIKTDNIYIIRNYAGNIWKRDAVLFVPPAAPTEVRYKNDNGVVTAEWTSNSPGTTFGIRRYWSFADLRIPANAESITFSIDTIAQPLYFTFPFHMYANDNGDYSDFTTAVERPNNAPVIDEIPNTIAFLGMGVQKVQLSGIDDGDSSEEQILTISATTSSTDILGEISVDYTSPANSATLEFEPLAFGSEWIEVTVQDNGGGANNSVSKMFYIEVVDPVTSIDQEAIVKSVYPNPTKSDAIVTFGSQKRRNVRILNSMGLKIDELDISEDEAVLYLSKYPAGLYLIEVRDAEKHVVLKITKE